MPQMSPLMWSTLFIMFSIAMLMFMSMNFFSTINKMKSTETINIKTSTKNWKW